MSVLPVPVTLNVIAFDLVAAIAGGAAMGGELAASEMLRSVKEYLRRDAPTNLLKILTGEVEGAFSDAEAEALLGQLAEQMRREEVFGAFREFVETSSPDALADVRRFLEAGFDENSLALSASQAATWIVDVLRSRLAEAQPKLERAIDARGELDRGLLQHALENRSEEIKRGHEELASGIEELALGNEKLDRSIAALSSTQFAIVRTRYASRDSSPAAAQEAVRQLADVSGDLLAQLYAHAGDPIDPQRVVGLIETPPAWADDAPKEWHRALARLVETAGEWGVAVAAWERAAELTEQGDTEQADAYARAAVAAGVAGDESRRRELLDIARGLASQAPRLVLEELSDDLDPAEALAILDRLHPDDPELCALVAVHRTLAYLLMPDLAAAESALAEAHELAPEAVFTRAATINVHVQRGRIDLYGGHPLDGPALRGAWQQALALREQLIAERRFEESCRLLMLACDALTVSGQPRRAIELLEEVRQDELEAPAGGEVLGDTALRCGAERRALELAAHAEETSGIARIRATAEFFTGSSENVLAAGEILDEIIEVGGREADLAAVARLALPLARRAVPWSDAAENHLNASGHKQAAVSGRALYLANIRHDYAGAYALLDEYQDEIWSAIARLRVASIGGLNDGIVEAAKNLLDYGPDQTHRLECAMALASSGQLDLAGDALRVLVRDRAAPGELASRGFDVLMRVLFDKGEQDQAVALFAEWQRERPGDPRSGPWQPRVANRMRRAAP